MCCFPLQESCPSPGSPGFHPLGLFYLEHVDKCPWEAASDQNWPLRGWRSEGVSLWVAPLQRSVSTHSK